METKISGYLGRSTVNQALRQIAVATFCGFWPADIYNNLKISVGVEAYTEINAYRFVDAIRKLIKSKRNVKLDCI